MRNQPRQIEPYKIGFQFCNYRQSVTTVITRISWSFHEKNVKKALEECSAGGLGLNIGLNSRFLHRAKLEKCAHKSEIEELMKQFYKL